MGAPEAPLGPLRGISPLWLVGCTVIGFLIGTLVQVWAAGRTLTVQQRAWEATTRALLTDSARVWEAREDALRAAEAAAFAVRYEALTRAYQRLTAATLADKTALADLRVALGKTTTLAACQAVGDTLAARCEMSLARKDSLLAVEGGRTTLARDSVTAVRGALSRLQGQYTALQRHLDSAPPLGEARWLFGLPRPELVLGVGCSGGLTPRIGCGLSVTAGIPLRRRR